MSAVAVGGGEEATAASTGPDEKGAASPPWQIRWKRPRWDRVVVGIDANDADALGGGDGGVASTGAAAPQHLDEHGGDVNDICLHDRIGDDWIPVCASSIVLTRTEARAAILELDRRGRLLVRKGGGQLGDQTFAEETDEKVEPTPKNSNPKIGGQKRARQHTIDNPKSPPPSSSFASPTSWFKSIVSPGKSMKSSLGKPPLVSKQSAAVASNASKNVSPEKQSRNDMRERDPSSPRSFSTFTLTTTTTPPPTNSNTTDDSPIGTPEESPTDSPPQIMDASTASSMIWEDMTLTSVSEEDAYRLFAVPPRVGGASSQAKLRDDGGGDGNSGNRESTWQDSEIGVGYHDNNHHERMMWNEWDGFDNVVLSVTIFATNAAMTTVAPSAVNDQPASGEVVVMELLSTKNPPLSNDSTTDNPYQGALATKQSTNQQQQTRTSKISSSSSNSSLSPGSSSAPPPPVPQLPLHRRSDSMNSTQSADSSHGGGSVFGESKNRNDIDGEEDKDGVSNHTRILTRRVLWWPSYIGGRTIHSEKVSTSESYANRRGPSFVSLGRDNVWKTYQNEEVATVADNEWKINETKRGSIDQDERSADAMDALQSLNFLFGSVSRGAQNIAKTRKSDSLPNDDKASRSTDSNESGNHRGQRREKKLITPLSMSFVTHDGHVYFYSAMRVLLSGDRGNRRQQNHVGLSNSFASLFLGAELYQRMNDSVMPLSRPRASMRLSAQLLMSENYGRSKANANLVPLSGVSVEKDDIIDEQEEEDSSNNWAGLMGAFDASIDPSSLPLRTTRKTNVVTGSCITTNTEDSTYLAICGRGLRKVSKHRNGNINHFLGGFVTFISLRNYHDRDGASEVTATESRTIYLPFAPAKIQPLYWMQMHFVVLLGESGLLSSATKPFAMAVRVDCCKAQHVGPSNPARFETIVINLPPINESLGSLPPLSFPPDAIIESNAVAISSIPTSPPGILLSFKCRECTSLAIVNHTLLPFQRIRNGCDAMSLSTVILPGHQVHLDPTAIEMEEKEANVLCDQITSMSNDLWCACGQGWSLVGIQGTSQAYYICWDGATENTQPFTLPFRSKMLPPSQSLVSGVMPLMSQIKYAESSIIQHGDKEKPPPAATASSYYSALPTFLHQDTTAGYSPRSRSLEESIKMTSEMEGAVLDDIIIHALDSISSPRLQPQESRSMGMSGSGGSRGKNIRSKRLLTMSHREKSRRLLRQCSIITVTIRTGKHLQSLTLRTNTIANPISTPFNQVLSWLCQRRDYHTAASVALSLLDDAEAVYELCGIPWNSFEDKLTYHKGLLDGITSLDDILAHKNDPSNTLPSLSDMAIGCMIKGGTPMSITLEGFLARNKLYNAPRACLMLVGALSSAMSNQPASKATLKKDGNIMNMLATVENPSDGFIWPVRCLMKMAVVRNCLPSAILMLNATIPNELRWRAPKKQGLAATTSRPSLGLFLALVEVILESSDKATRLFLNMMDEESSRIFWYSIDNYTKLALCLISIRGKYVMLQEPEVRTWILERLKDEISSTDPDHNDGKGHFLPDEWLRDALTGALYNAGSKIGLEMDDRSESSLSSLHDSVCYRQDMLRANDLLVPQESCDFDFDLVISILLILARNGCEWRDGSQYSTQTLLNSVCDLAGRNLNSMKTKFIFDKASIMRQCVMSNNLQAAAFLVGGKKGLILECADQLVSELAMTVKDAEIALHVGSLAVLKGTISRYQERIAHQNESSFRPSSRHQHILWLLEEHVLSVHTYGQFNAASNKGKIDPVFAGRVCLRSWYCLTSAPALRSSAAWLEEWIRRKLDLTKGSSPRRLACAALVRILLWAENTEGLDLTETEDEPLLATILQLEGTFMAELAHACCGLIQSIPSNLAEEITSSLSNPHITSLLNSAQ